METNKDHTVLCSDSHFSFDDYLNYQSKIDEYNSKNRRILFPNESGIHAAMVTKILIDRARENQEPINMFCGSFYLFRDRFKDNIKEEKQKIKSSVKKEQEKLFSKFDPYGDLIASLIEFFHKNLSMNVIIEQKEAFRDIKSDSNWIEVYDKWIKFGLLKFYQLDDLEAANDNHKFDHFMVSGTSFRKECSGEKRTAICCFNRPDHARICQNNFDLLKEFSKEYYFE